MSDDIVFLETRPNGKGSSLYTLPGQKTGVRKKIIGDMMTHGGEAVRRRHPVGTVFATDGKALRMRGGCYFAPVLIPFLSPGGDILDLTLSTEEVLRKYESIRQEM